MEDERSDLEKELEKEIKRVKSIAKDLLYNYGYKSLLREMERFKQLENNEACFIFKEVIEELNKLVKDKLHTRL